jgi:hypothetical protein
MELLPVAKHSVNGPHMIEYFALIAAWMGEKELACEHMERRRAFPVLDCLPTDN